MKENSQYTIDQNRSNRFRLFFHMDFAYFLSVFIRVNPWFHLFFRPSAPSFQT
jgi:hypothetical protein